MVEEEIQVPREEQQQAETTLVPLEKYLTAGIHIGTKFRTKHMAQFIYKVNPNGLSVLDIQKIDSRIATAARFLSKFEPSKILVTGRRENSWQAIKAFAKVTGAREYAGRYPAGLITNPKLEGFYEPEVLVVTDPWPDKNAMHDAYIKGIPIVALVDSNNSLENIDLAIPCNNKGPKSLGLVFWLLANQYLRERGIIPKDKELDIPVEKFVE